MTQEEIIEGNKLIAEFMGVKIGEDLYSWRPGVIDSIKEHNLQYHSSWDWLMPICLKFCESYENYPSSKCEGMIMNLDNEVSSYDITKAFKQLVICIKWYNEYKSKTT